MKIENKIYWKSINITPYHEIIFVWNLYKTIYVH